MKGIKLMLKREPAIIGTTVAAIMPVLILFGIDPKVGGAVSTAFTVIIGLWIRSQVYTEQTVGEMVELSATAVAGQLTEATVGEAGTLTAGGQAVVDGVVSGVMGN